MPAGPTPRLAAALLAALPACAALRLPPQDDPDRSRHSYEIVGEVRRAGTLAVVPGATLEVDGAAEVIGDAHADQTGRFWLKVSGITPPRGTPVRGGPAGSVTISARGAALCVAATRVTLPATGPVILVADACPKP